MSIAARDAFDEICGIVNTWMTVNSAAILGYVPEIRWPGNPKGDHPAALNIWARVSQRIVKDSQTGINAIEGQRLYTAVGLLYVQIFCPRSVSNSLVNGRILANGLRDRFRHPSPSSEIRFRDQKVVEVSAEDDYYPLNVVVTYEYDSIQ